MDFKYGFKLKEGSSDSLKMKEVCVEKNLALLLALCPSEAQRMEMSY